MTHLNRAKKVKTEPSDTVFMNDTLHEYYPDSAVESELAAGSAEDSNLDTQDLVLTSDTNSTSSSSTKSTISIQNQTKHSNSSSEDLDNINLMQEDAYDRMFDKVDESAYSIIFLGYILIYIIL